MTVIVAMISALIGTVVGAVAAYYFAASEAVKEETAVWRARGVHRGGRALWRPKQWREVEIEFVSADGVHVTVMHSVHVDELFPPVSLTWTSNAAGAVYTVSKERER